jgi:hypothetical protein
MNRGGVLPLAILFATAGAFAQQPAAPDSSKNVSLTHLREVGADCPLGVQASHGAGVPIAMNAGPAINGKPIVNGQPLPWTRDSAPTLDQRLHLTMINLRAHDVVSAEITAHGFSDKWRAIDLTTTSQTPDLAKTVDVVLDLKGNGHASTNVSLNHFTAVTSIDLTSVTYADGSTWHATSQGACSVTPDLMMLVNAEPAR